MTRITWTGNPEPIEAPVLETAVGQCLKELGPWPYTATKTKPGAKIIPLHVKASGEGLREAEADPCASMDAKIDQLVSRLSIAVK